MKKDFSKNWKSSKQPRKQRKYLAKAPLHIKKNFLGSNLSKELRIKYKKRSLSVRKGDVVKIMRGKFKKKQGRIIKVNIKTSKIYIEGIQTKKIEGSKVDVPIKASNLQIIELNLEDRKRNKALGTKTKQEPKKEIVKDTPKQDLKKPIKEETK